MSPAEVGPFEPASFRDPAARVLRHDGQILRYLTPAAWRDFEMLSSTRFYREFTDSGRLVATTPAKAFDGQMVGIDGDDAIGARTNGARVAEYFVIAETERLQAGTRTMYYVRPKHAI